MSERNWHRVENELPPEGVEVLAIAPSGAELHFKRKGSLWLIGPSFDTYVYYPLEYWRELEDS